MEERQRQLSRPLPPQGRGRPTSPDLPPWRAGRQSEVQGGPFELPLGAGPPVARRPPPQVVRARFLERRWAVLDSRAERPSQGLQEQAKQDSRRPGLANRHEDGLGRPYRRQHKVRRLHPFHLSSLMQVLNKIRAEMNGYVCHYSRGIVLL